MYLAKETSKFLSINQKKRNKSMWHIEKLRIFAILKDKKDWEC